MSRARDIADIGEDVTSLATDAELSSGLASKLDLAGGKILQVVRATDSTNRTTTSATISDVTGMSVTITPEKSTSAILVICTVLAEMAAGTSLNRRGNLLLTDSSNNTLSGAEGGDNFALEDIGEDYTLTSPIVLVGYSTPATTSATTYKLRFDVSTAGATLICRNASVTGQMYAIEVSA